MKPENTLIKLKYSLTVYLILVGCVIPLYLKNGYTGAGERKALLYVTATFLLVLLSLFFIGSNRSIDLKRIFARVAQKKTDGADQLVVLLLFSAVSQVLSFSLSKYKSIAWLGITGWRMGLIPQLMFAFFAVLFAKYYELTNGGWYILFSGELATLLIGIINRLGFYPIPGTNIGMHYISTVGNVDWFLTYLSVLYPLSIGLIFHLWNDKRAKTGLKLLVASDVVLAQLVLIMLGSSSSAMVLILPVFLFIISAIRSGRGQLFLLLLTSIGCMAELSWMIRIIDGGNQWNDIFSPYNPLTPFVKLHGGLGLAISTIFAWLYLKNQKRQHPARPNILFQTESRICRVFFFAPIILLVVQIIAPTALGDGFGNGRGYIWRITSTAIKSMRPIEILFGCGQDTMGLVIKSICSDAELAEHYGDAMLMNAHSLLLNKLLENGILGIVTFLALTAGALYYLRQKSDHTEDFRASAVKNAVLSYYLIEAVMFEQVVAAPLFYIMLGFAGALLRESGETGTRLYM